MVTNEENLLKLETQMSLELKELRSATCLELEIGCCTSAGQDCGVFVEPDAPSETVPLTEELMQIAVLRGGRDFRTKDFVALKDKSLVLAT